VNVFVIIQVETIGDAYFIVSGVPVPNGNRHSAEMAFVALGIVDVKILN
jgi:hypothetical protein